MVTLFFCSLPGLVHEVQRRFEVRKFEFLLDVMVVHDIPILHLGRERLDFLGREGWNTSAAGHARLLRKSRHIILQRQS